MKKTSLKDFLKDELSENELELVNRSFEIVGDIAIVEIPEELDSKDKIIGNALLKVNSNIKTVLKKSGIHQGKFRTQDLIYVCGEEKEDTIYKENGIRLKINPGTVYFSARLSTERGYLMEKLEPKKRVLVMFSGAGPYSFSALKYQPELLRITSIEINPEGHKYALENLELNKNLVKKSEIFDKIKKFLKENDFPIYEKKIIEIVNSLKFNFICGDVRYETDKLNLKECNSNIDSYDNYIFEGNIENIFDSLKKLEKNELVLNLDNIMNRDNLLYFLILFSYKFNLLCKINDKHYIFDNSLLKSYLINYLESDLNIDKINLYDEIFMPLPKDAEHFLDCAFKMADSGCIVHMYDFVLEEDFPKLSENKVIESAKKYNKSIEIISTRKVGQYSPRKYRVCCDFKIL